MADYTATPNYAFKMPTDHVNTNTWGGYNNGNWSSADGLIGSIRAQLTSNGINLFKTNGVEADVLYWGVIGTSKLRWAVGIDGGTESGGNVNSNYHINRYDDNGNLIDAPLQIARSNGWATFTDNVTVTGNLTTGGSATIGGGIVAVQGVVGQNGWVASQASAGTDAAFALVNSTGTEMAALQWNHSSNLVYLYNATGGATVNLLTDGSVAITGKFSANGSITGTGYLSRNGVGGSSDSGHQYNIYWSGSANRLWLDNSDWGPIQTTSDYRMKKDVAPLGSMWDAVKALKPISYTVQDWTPPASIEKQKDVGGPLIVGDDVERWGFLAHELQETLVESAANGVKDDPIQVQSPTPFTVIAALTKALQEAMARIEALEAAR